MTNPSQGGPPTRHRPTTPEERQAEKRRNYLRAIGQAGFVDAAPAQERVRQLVAEGITMGTIAERTGISLAMINMHARGYGHRGPAYPITECRMETARAILAARFTPDDSALCPSIGPRRRLQALSCAGYRAGFLGAELGMDVRQLHAMLIGRTSRQHMHTAQARRILALYDKYDGRDPAEIGETARDIKYVQTCARKHGWAPSHCWDPDTLDDPEAIPEWTGACGSERGYQIHWREVIAACRPCREAHYVYKHWPRLIELMAPQ